MKHIKNFWFKNRSIILTIVILSLTLILVYHIIPDKTDQLEKYGELIQDSKGRIIKATLNENQQWCFTPLQYYFIPTKLKTATLDFEDKWFYKHPGVNLISLIKAFFINLRNGRTISGGSTITMQLARLSDPKPRNFINKIIEIMQAFKFEIKYSKEEILAKYLNHAPYGRNIQGYRAASLFYFGKEPYKLNWSEASVLAVLPNSPGLISPGKNQGKLVRKRDRLLKKLLLRDLIDKDTFNLSILENVPDKIYSLL